MKKLLFIAIGSLLLLNTIAPAVTSDAGVKVEFVKHISAPAIVEPFIQFEAPVFASVLFNERAEHIADKKAVNPVSNSPPC